MQALEEALAPFFINQHTRNPHYPLLSTKDKHYLYVFLNYWLFDLSISLRQVSTAEEGRKEGNQKILHDMGSSIEKSSYTVNDCIN